METATCDVTVVWLSQSNTNCPVSTLCGYLMKKTDYKKIANVFCFVYVLGSTHKKFIWVPMPFRYPACPLANHYKWEPIRTKPGDDPTSSLSPGNAQHAHPAARCPQPEPSAEFRHARSHTDGTSSHWWVGLALSHLWKVIGLSWSLFLQAFFLVDKYK